MRRATLLGYRGGLAARLFQAGRTEAVQVLLLQRGSPLAGRRAGGPPCWRACPCRCSWRRTARQSKTPVGHDAHTLAVLAALSLYSLASSRRRPQPMATSRAQSSGWRWAAAAVAHGECVAVLLLSRWDSSAFTERHGQHPVASTEDQGQAIIHTSARLKRVRHRPRLLRCAAPCQWGQRERRQRHQPVPSSPGFTLSDRAAAERSCAPCQFSASPARNGCPGLVRVAVRAAVGPLAAAAPSARLARGLPGGNAGFRAAR